MYADREACLAAGMNDHVGKPFDLHLLVQTLIRHTRWAERSLPLPAPGGGVPLPGAAEPAPANWPAGLDIDQALARMGGQGQLLQRAIAAFVADARLLPERLEQALQQGLLVQVTRELHSAKGLAATIGASALSGLAADAEKQVAAAQVAQDCAGVVAQFSQQLLAELPALEAVARRLQGAQVQPPASAAGRGSQGDRAQWQRLLASLQASDMVAMELHAELRQHLDPVADAKMEPALQTLDQAMADLDFEAAATACEQLVRLLDTHDART
jgi:HPt (histidine-containing phosphotransfer) domain-containing protein